MNFEVTGKLIVKENIQEISASFKKREFVLEIENERNSEWNDFVKFELKQDKCSSIDSIALGQKVKVSFNLRGRKWEKDGRVNYFTSLEAWRVEGLGAHGTANDPMPQYQSTDIPPADDATGDLPF
jgi:hypothetical protein